MAPNPKKKGNKKSPQTKSQKSPTPTPTPTPTLTVAPERECTEQEYQDLLSIARSLTPTEAKQELLECARYGELDSVRALLQIHAPNSTSDSNYVDSKDEKSGSTALHMASANGHTTTVHLLLSHHASFLPNSSGKNSPLHWAAANGHEKIVKLLLSHDFGGDTKLDVLEKNGAGRSALTEGFSSENTRLVGMLLEHDSAAEEHLLGGAKEVEVPKEMDGDDGTENDKNGGGKGKDNDDNDDNDDGTTKNNGTSADTKTVPQSSPADAGLVHEFDFLRDGRVSKNDDTNDPNKEEEKPQPDKTLLIRELPITNADSPFGDDATSDTTGLGIWCASLVMARWMATKSTLGRFDDKTVLELGAGCGVPGLTVALYSRAREVYVTDLNVETVRNLEFNVGLNANRPSTCEGGGGGGGGDWMERVRATAIDWGDESTWPEEKLDYVIGSDLIYQKSIVPLLKKVVRGLLKPDGQFLYVCPSDGRDGLKEFIATMKREGFRCASEEVAPDIYRSNPLSNGDADDAFLHFYELPVTEYRLYEFRQC